MKTSAQWWQEVKSNPAKLNAWLQKQHWGESLAAQRVAMIKVKFELTPEQAANVDRVAADEAKHAKWIRELLTVRGLHPLSEHAERYWAKALTFRDAIGAFAVAAHAEKMRLERIRVIANDESAPHDIVEVFRKILPDEEAHEEIFRNMTPVAEYEAARANHDAGVRELGLVI
jgi:rubrerythrin